MSIGDEPLRKWPLANAFTGHEETWMADASGFLRVGTGGSVLSLGGDDIDGLAAASVAACGRLGRPLCLRIFPSAFRSCPWCREELTQPVPSPLWSYPDARLGDPRRVPFAVRVPGPADQDSIAAVPPEGNSWVFAVAGKPARLLALSSVEGVAHVWSRSRQRWTRISGRFPLPANEVAMGVAATSAGAWITTVGGLAFLALEGGVQAPRVLTGGKHQNVGAPFLLGDGIALAPVQQESALGLERVEIKNGALVRDIIPIPGSPQADLFGSPVRLSTGDVVWAGKNGVIAVHLETIGSEPRLAQTVWNAWPAGTYGLPNLGAAIVQNVPWLPVISFEDGTSVRAYRRPVAGQEPDCWREHKGYGHVIGAGAILYRRRDRVELPWTPASSFTFGGDTVRGVVPLLSFADSSFVGLTYESAPGDFDPWASLLDARPGTFEAALWLSEPNHPGIRLFPQIQLGCLQDVQVFVFDRQLYVYERLANRLRRWACDI